ncbi:ComEC/Rec2 family competence protein [Hephaestia mangrovi]|uniref:ComEC/Rec2 family competence protein n=1 Tax=Hephaestia mangrovi TaxID=2873268 RepID=UPI001CA77D8F|nr:ComEC/Rec2 family competence protein [Hephaestia mangrovi]MBY8829416.1 ComEC family competence protein [Hephaestia mangrovi]
MASSAAPAPSTAPRPLQIAGGWLARGGDAIEAWLEAERDQLALWLPVAIGAGIAAWYLLDDSRQWLAVGLALAALGIAALAVGRHGRALRVVAIGALAAVMGVALIWWRAERVAAPVLDRAVIARFVARVDRVDPLPARELVRIEVTPISSQPTACAGRTCPPATLPPHFRVNLQDKDVPVGLGRGAVIRLRARLMPPPQPGVPGAYDYAQTAWFHQIGATGRGFAPVEVIAPGRAGGDGIRPRLTRHIEAMLPGSAGGIASALVTGDTGAIGESDADAMRRAGLAHLLSISGLHVTAVVGITMWLVLRLLAWSPWLALRFRLPMVAAGAGAVAAVGYTLLAGAEVPTVRSCVAALLVLAAMMLGREAITLRLVAAGAVIVLALWPESLAGPSFQLSFAAVTAIVALHEHPAVRRWVTKRDEPLWRRLLREAGGLLLTGLLVEAALAPIAFYHFHREGMYGAIANIVAIPLTTFVVMPFEALALLCDTVGLGAPVWWLVGVAMRGLLWIAHTTADAPGSVQMLPLMPAGAFALIVFGGLWLALWRTRVRRLGLVPLAIGAAWALATPAPDLLVTGDGQHVALRTASGIAILRERSGDYTKAMLSESGGVDSDEEPATIAALPNAQCSRDACIVDHHAGGRVWRIMATRSGYLIPIDDLAAVCRNADIVISERWLPSRCRPRWLKLDSHLLRQTGGLAISLARGRIASVTTPGDHHPWRDPPLLKQPPPPWKRQS